MVYCLVSFNYFKHHECQRKNQEIHRLFGEIRSEFNSSFVIITHNRKLAETADRIIEMSDGILI